MESATLSEAGHMDDDVKTFLRQHYRGSVIRNHPVADFVRYVWDFDFEYIETEGTSFTLPEDLCVEYLRGAWKDHSREITAGHEKPKRTEQAAAITFDKIWKCLVSQLPPSSQQNHFLNLKDRVVDGAFAQYKPDFCITPLPDLVKQTWDILLGCGEMKKLFWTEELYRGYVYSRAIDVLRIKKVISSSSDVTVRYS